MKMTFDLEIPETDFQSFIEEMVTTYFDFLFEDLGLTAKDMDSLKKEAKSIFREAIQNKLDSWYDEIDHESFAYALEDNPALKKAIQALRKREETEEQADRKERIQSAKTFLQKNGYKVTEE